MSQQNNKNNISLVLLTHNEEGSLQKNFTWLDQCPDINEIIAVDDNSTDNTLKTLKTLASKNRKIKTFSRGLDNDYSAQRQFAISKSANNWILWLDPDEKPTDKLIEFIKHIDIQKNIDSYSFPRLEHFLNHPLYYGETACLWFTRLFDRRLGHFQGQVHEVWQSEKPTKYISCPIEHFSNSTLKTFLEKINNYSSIRAQELQKQGTHTNLFQIIFYPLFKFLQNYFFRLGFLDSTPGIIFALGMSFHTFLVRAKLWHLWQK